MVSDDREGSLDDCEGPLIEYLEGALSPTEREGFVATLDKAQLAELAALSQAGEQLANLPDVAVPGAFAAAVVSAVAPYRPAPRSRIMTWLGNHPLLGWETGAVSFAMLLVVVMAGSNPLAPVPLLDHPSTGLATVQAVGLEQPMQARFSLYAPHARTVSLIGDFNGWGSLREVPLRRQVDGSWVADLPLPSGRYQYAFLVDDRTIVTDPRAERHVSDDFGRQNAVVTIL